MLYRGKVIYFTCSVGEFEEDLVYQALDELSLNMDKIKKGLNEKLNTENRRLLLYDLSNSYFTGTKAELGGRGHSKEKRHDRFIVTYGLVMNQNNMPLDIRVWKGGTEDYKTVLETFKEWKEYYLPNHKDKNTQAIWLADRSLSGEPIYF